MIETSLISSVDGLHNFVNERERCHFSFDFWNTIAFSNPDFKIERETLLNQFCSTKKNITSVISEISINYNKNMMQLNEVVSTEELNFKLYDYIELSLDYRKQVLRKTNELFLEFPPKLNKNFLEIFDYLNSMSKLNTSSILSNTAFVSGETIRKFLDSVNLRFDFYVFSDEVLLAKPSNGIFQLLLEKSMTLHENKIISNDIVHIGDDYEADVFGALNFGINAFLIGHE